MKNFASKPHSARRRFRTLLRDLTPPLALSTIHRARRGRRGFVAEWEILPGGFEQARRDAKIKGWDQQAVFNAYAGEISTLREHLAAGVPFGMRRHCDPSSYDAIFNHNIAACWGWVLGHAAAQSSQLSVLDWGGALGHYYLWARELRPDLTLDYTVKEMPLIVEQGKSIVPEVRFCGDEALERQYDLVVAATSLHYEEEWRVLLQRLLDSARKCAFLMRIPICETGESFVLVQRAYAHGYETEYASWCFGRDEFVRALESCGWQIEREIVTGERIEIKGTAQIADYRGFLVRPATTETLGD